MDMDETLDTSIQDDHIEETGRDRSAGKKVSELGYPVSRVKVLHSSETELCSFPKDAALGEGDYVVTPTKYGKDLGCVLGILRGDERVAEEDIRPIDRIADEKDLQRYQENRLKEKEAFSICREKIANHGLDMKLVSAHYLLEEPKVLFFFTAENRVDFRELVKDLVSVFRMRIELRQIGVRDESRVVGGLGVCGRAYCCHSITDRLIPVSIKMAKEQNLSLNSMKISGPCGRLLCCLSYECVFYHEEKHKFPPDGYKFQYNDVMFKVIEVNVLSRKVKLAGSDGRVLDVPETKFHYCREESRWKLTDLESGQ
jgi:cell fate regulator YaaT (PSP1 superfamily)